MLIKRNLGFSLIELLVAGALSTLVMGMLFSNSKRIGDFYIKLKRESTRILSLQRIEKLMREDSDPGTQVGGIFSFTDCEANVVNPDDCITKSVFNHKLVGIQNVTSGEFTDPRDKDAPAVDKRIVRLHMMKIIRSFKIIETTGDLDKPVFYSDYIAPTDELPLPPTTTKDTFYGLLVNTAVSNAYFDPEENERSKKTFRKFAYVAYQLSSIEPDADNDGNTVITTQGVIDTFQTGISKGVGMFINANRRTDDALEDSVNPISYDFSPDDQNAIYIDIPVKTIEGEGISKETTTNYTYRHFTALHDVSDTTKDDDAGGGGERFTFSGPVLHQVKIIEYLLVPSQIGKDADGRTVVTRSVYRSEYPCFVEQDNNLKITSQVPSVRTNIDGITTGCNLVRIATNVGMEELDFGIGKLGGNGSVADSVEISLGLNTRRVGSNNPNLAKNNGRSRSMGVITQRGMTQRLSRPTRQTTSYQDTSRLDVDFAAGAVLNCGYFKGLTLQQSEDKDAGGIEGLQIPSLCTGLPLPDDADANFRKFVRNQSQIPADVIFYLDSTRSMQPYIDGVKRYFKAFVAQLSSGANLSFYFHFREFRDGYNEYTRTPAVPNSRLGRKFIHENIDSYWPPVDDDPEADDNFFKNCGTGKISTKAKNFLGSPFGSITAARGGDVPENPTPAMAHSLREDGGALDGPTQTPSTGKLNPLEAGRFSLNKIPLNIKGYLYDSHSIGSGGRARNLKGLAPYSYFDPDQEIRKNKVIIAIMTDSFPPLPFNNFKNCPGNDHPTCQLPDDFRYAKEGDPGSPAPWNNHYLHYTPFSDPGTTGTSCPKNADSSDWPVGREFSWSDTQLGEKWKNNLLFYYIQPDSRTRCFPYNGTEGPDPANAWTLHTDGYSSVRDQAMQWLRIPLIKYGSDNFDIGDVKDLQGQVTAPQYNQDNIIDALKSYLQNQSAFGYTAIGDLSNDYVSESPLDAQIVRDIYGSIGDNENFEDCGTSTSRCFNSYLTKMFGIQLRELIARTKTGLDPEHQTCKMFGNVAYIVHGVKKKCNDDAADKPCVRADGVFTPLAFVHFETQSAVTGDSKYDYFIASTADNHVRVTDKAGYLDADNETSTTAWIRKTSGSGPSPDVFLTEVKKNGLNYLIPEAYKAITQYNAEKGDKREHLFGDYVVVEIQTLFCCQSDPNPIYGAYDPAIDKKLDRGEVGHCQLRKSSRFVGFGGVPEGFNWDIEFESHDVDPECETYTPDT